MDIDRDHKAELKDDREESWSGPDPITRARELGAEHGRAAAEAWWPEAVGDVVPAWNRLQIREALERGEDMDWPQPDLSGSGVRAPLELLEESETAYEAAFTTAVVATIRAKCEEVAR